MGNNVFANGRELACKSGEGKVIAAFPDVCFTPPDKVPPTPPGVPIPYPLTSMASDTNDGTKSVIISKKEVMLRDSSNFKKCMGDDAAQTAKKGMVSSKITGKVYFTSWSMDVKIQKKNAVRHLDTMTSNHSSPNANAAVPWSFLDGISRSEKAKCKEEKKKEEEACSEDGASRGKKTKYKSAAECCDGGECEKARKCMLVPYGGKGSPNCCKGVTGDHLVEASSYAKTRGGTPLMGCDKYNLNEAPTCCAEGGAYSKDHGFLSALRGEAHMRCPVEDLKLANGNTLSGKKVTTNGAAKANGARSVRAVFTHCSEECIRAQLDAYDKRTGISDDTKIKAITYGDGVKWIQRLM